MNSWMLKDDSARSLSDFWS